MHKKKFKPETLMMSYGYKPELSEGAVKCPIFQTSTFAFKTAEEGKAFFEVAYGIREKNPEEEMGLIYSRLNNPDLEILENRLTLWDEAEECAVFESGMSAITTVLLEFLRPGDLLVYSKPLYGGSDHFIKHILPEFGIHTIGIHADHTKAEIIEKIETSEANDRLKLIFVETPANPTNAIIDITMCHKIAEHFSTEDNTPLLAVDNTYMGPLWSHPLKLGADLVLYSATKYIGGHSDVIAGACLGSKALMARIKGLRTFLGNMAGPWTGWLLMRSLETLKPRMEKQAENARMVADFLRDHPKVESVFYLGHLRPGSQQYKVYQNQYSSAGAMISFDIKGGEKEAFTFLNKLQLFHLAVSLGSTESLAQHPYTMTHADVSSEEKNALGLTEKLVRLSIGVEDGDDLIWDITQALEQV
ncbi:MAG: cystathionine gamma-synthase family protein [Candidatus Marinimicrobia bacterium]|jgi:methionine-gamma-lyase|nr:cystathionine gamma-synthase family protein [Candidatus Neomarinimicrobiota bacterium]MBT4593923.1 cystathionine gamma-synthase family protein [Candidatus Neomarinimicrobiota bacterium]MBT4991354.1 cystathionine gamma-synthase family protein [Candidatus Neomarinimicrobiota bacterium]MBT5405655.1 cystathionine gamma-synthase family protein [Candidatus Neomarinimicrobiota bacterium]MBT7512797.1 cystathionine gamma-synthase family protein [Candidatus Neomarinimicrobiota bacterium]